MASFIGAEFINSISISPTNIMDDQIQVAMDIDKYKSDLTDISQESNQKLQNSRGVLASIINSFASKSIYITAISAIRSLVGSENISIMIFIFLSFVFLAILNILFVNTYIIISRRIFLEGRTYKKIQVQSFLYLFRVKKLCKSAITMLRVSIYLVLWSFTIVGYFIKRYSYYLVPYIIAENPNISSKDAIKLSRDIINNKIENIHLLNDKYLFEKADKSILEEKYDDVAEEIAKEETEEPIKLSGIKRFLIDNFGISVLEEKNLEKKI